MLRLPAVDEANLVLDHPGQVNVFLIAGVFAPGGFVAEDGAPDLPALRAALRTRVAALPLLSRSLRGAGRRHYWAADEPDLEQHVRLVDAVEGIAGLERLAADLMIRPLPRGRPLWEFLVVPGADATGTGFVLRIHHAVADGMSAVAIVQQLFDAEPPLADTGVHEGAPLPSTTAEHAGPSTRLARVRFGIHRIWSTLQSRGVAPTALLGERSPRRGVLFVGADLDRLAARARSLGATVNDALLAATASGFVAALSDAGEPIPGSLPVSVPVALARGGEAANQVGVMLVQLPLGTGDASERLRLISAQTREEKVRAREQGTLEFMRGPRGARMMDRVGRTQRLVAGFVTNVPGPRGVLHLAGAPVAALWPVAVLAGNVRLGVAAVSYDGRLCCSIHFDADHVAGVPFGRAMAAELIRLGG